MASLSLFSQIETNLMSNCNVIELLSQLKRARAHGKNYVKLKAHLVPHLLRNCLLVSHDVASCIDNFIAVLYQLTRT